MTSLRWLTAFNVALIVLAGGLAWQGRVVPAVSLFVASGLFALWQNVLASAVPQAAQVLRVEPFFHPTHYVQACLHTSMYCYLGLYWDVVAAYVPLLFAQILCGYLLDMLLSWSRRGVWRAGLGVVPIILSTNLFMWFKDDYFYLQLGLIALAFCGKEFITWTHGGRRRHIFNPSAFALSIVSLILLCTNTVHITRGIDIAVAFEIPPNFYEVIFLLGLVVQTLFITTPVTFGTAFSLYVLYWASIQLLGQPLLVAPIPAAVFLGMTFLVTDPATSPRSHFGRFLYGLAYGTGVWLTFVLFRMIHQPSFFDKLLIVPFVNLLVPSIDWLCDWIGGRMSARRSLASATQHAAHPAPVLGNPLAGLVAPALAEPPGVGPRTTNRLQRVQLIPRLGWVAAYLVLFVVMLPVLKAPDGPAPEGSPEWNRRNHPLIPAEAARLSEDFKVVYDNHQYGRRDFPKAYLPFGFREELAHLTELREIYRHGPSDRQISGN